MNRVNPLYIALFLLLLFGVVLYQNHKIKNHIFKSEQQLKVLEKTAIKIGALRKYWGDKKLQKQRVLSIINTPFIKQFLKSKDERKNGIKIVLEGVEAGYADQIIQKIFNSFVLIKNFTIERKDSRKINMQMEFLL